MLRAKSRVPNCVLANSRRFFTFLWIFDHSTALFGARRGFKMILSRRAPASFNMSSYRTIWTHFRPNFIFFDNKSGILVNKIFLKCKSPHLAILIM